MRVTSLQAVAHGADGVLYFQWRQSRGGAEKFHSAIVPHAGPDSRTFGEVSALGAELAAHSELAGTLVKNQVALLLDWESWWANDLDSHPSAEADQLSSLKHCYLPLFEGGYGTDVVHPDSDLSTYRVVIVPGLYLLRASTAARLEQWVRDGGQLIVSFFSGVVDECDRVYLGGYLGPLASTVGADVEEFFPLAAGSMVELSSGGTGTVWSERVRLRPGGARAIEAFTSGDLAGLPAVTRHDLGAGTCWYLATRPDEATTARLFGSVLAAAGVSPVVPGLPEGVQAAVRGQQLILLNHTAETRVAGEVTLGPFDVVIRRLT
jgi:beta-galactosidase